MLGHPLLTRVRSLEPASRHRPRIPRDLASHLCEAYVAPVLTAESRTACHAHRIALAVFEETRARIVREEAEAEAAADGFHVAAWRRGLDMMEADPAGIAELERHTSTILLAVRAALVIEDVHVFESTTDQSDEARAARIRDEGYHAAVLGRADDIDHHKPADQAVWLAGWHAFRCDLAAFEAARAVAAGGGAFSIREGRAQIRSHTMETDHAAS